MEHQLELLLQKINIGVDVLGSQVEPLVQEIVSLGVALNTIGIILSSIAVVLSVIALCWVLFKGSSDDGVLGLVAFLSIAMLVFSIARLGGCTINLIKAKTTPRVYVIEQIKELTKHKPGC